MQTFLPYSDFARSAHVLDTQRLGKQRVEVLQIFKALTLPNYGWKNHPAVRMWLGCEKYLGFYGVAICNEWINRGYKDTCRGKIIELASPFVGQMNAPEWLGYIPLHASHRSNLLRKDAEYYEKFGWLEPHDLPYYWPLIEVTA